MDSAVTDTALLLKMRAKIDALVKNVDIGIPSEQFDRARAIENLVGAYDRLRRCILETS